MWCACIGGVRFCVLVRLIIASEQALLCFFVCFYNRYCRNPSVCLTCFLVQRLPHTMKQHGAQQGFTYDVSSQVFAGSRDCCVLAVAASAND